MKHKRLYISADIEGVAGVVTTEHLTPAGFEYQQAREWMTNEVIAACEAAKDCGIEEIVISDSHGNGQSLLLDRLPKGTQVVRAWPRPLCMMEGIDHGGFDAAILLGYHSGATDLRGVLAHTLHGRGISEIKLNGEAASETVISAATAGHFKVPVIMVSGDDAYADHATHVLDDVEAAVVKWAHSATSARTLLPSDACELIHQHTTRALNRLDAFEPYSLAGPVTLEVNCKQRRAAEVLSFLPSFKLVSATQLEYQAQDMVEVSKVLSFLLASGVLIP